MKEFVLFLFCFVLGSFFCCFVFNLLQLLVFHRLYLFSNAEFLGFIENCRGGVAKMIERGAQTGN